MQLSGLDMLERSLERLKAELDLFQTQSEAWQLETASDAATDSPSPEESKEASSIREKLARHLQAQQETLAALQAQTALLKQTQGQAQQQQERGAANLLKELEALLEAQAQQLRLFQSQRRQAKQTQEGDRLQLEKQIETLQTALEEAEQRIAAAEAQSLESRTWGISVNVQRQTAQEHAVQLQAALNERRSQLKALSEELEERQETLTLQRRLAESQTTVITALQRDLSTAHRTIEALEKQLLHGSRQQAGVIQLRQESELQRRSEQSRQRILEEERVAHQETIAQQAEQIRHLETQNQEWRQRSLAHQHQLQNIKDWAEQWGQDLPEALQALLAEPLPEAFPLLNALTSAVQESTPSQKFSEQERPTEREHSTERFRAAEKVGSVISFPVRHKTDVSLDGGQDQAAPQTTKPDNSKRNSTSEAQPSRASEQEDVSAKTEKDILELPQFPQ